MPLPPWTIEMIRRGISDVAKRASDPETLEKLKTQATEILQDLPETAARSIDAVVKTAEAGKASVEKWARKQTAIATPMINVSGTLMHPLGTGVPVADRVVQSGIDLLRGDCIADSETSDRIRRKLAQQMDLPADYSVACASSFDAALTAFSQLVEERPLVIHRSHAVHLPNGLPLPDAFGTLLPVIQEVGGIGTVSLKDYENLESFCTIVADVGDLAFELQDFGRRDVLQAVVLPIATVSENSFGLPSAIGAINKGASFAILPGGGLCGGPECGLIIGPSQSMSVITGSMVWQSLQASIAVQSMMTAAMQPSLDSPLPIRTLLETSEANLQSRLERMMARLAVSPRVSETRITHEPAKILSDRNWTVPSRQLRLKHSSRRAEEWALGLQDDYPSVVASVENDELVVDLRWSIAAKDNEIVIAIGGGQESTTNE